MKTMDTMETKIKNDKQFLMCSRVVADELVPALLSRLMEWKKPDEMPEDIAELMAKICAVCVHLTEYVEIMEEDADDDEQPKLVN